MSGNPIVIEEMPTIPFLLMINCHSQELSQILKSIRFTTRWNLKRDFKLFRPFKEMNSYSFDYMGNKDI